MDYIHVFIAEEMLTKEREGLVLVLKQFAGINLVERMHRIYPRLLKPEEESNVKARETSIPGTYI